MLKKVFFRIEHKGTHYGLFRNPIINYQTILGLEQFEKRYNNHFPRSDADAGLKDFLSNPEHNSYKWRHAFRNMEELQEWISKDLVKFISDAGFGFYAITTDNYYVGTFQAIYHQDNELSKMDITDQLLSYPQFSESPIC